MKKSDLIRDSILAISEYYKNNLEPFFEFIADDVLWIGPRAGMVLRGRENIIKTWSAADSGLLFTMEDITADSVSTGRNNLEVILEYFVYTHFPTGEVDKHHQRIHYSWGLRTIEENGEHVRVPKICMIHISNISDGMNDDAVKVYASTPGESQRDAIGTAFAGRIFSRTVSGKGENEITYYFNSAAILWIESADNGRHSIIHTLEGSYKAIERLRWFEEQFPDVLLRVHTSYLINPLHVRSVKRFELTLSDGTVLGIPQKKYTAFRKQLDGWKWELNS